MDTTLQVLEVRDPGILQSNESSHVQIAVVVAVRETGELLSGEGKSTVRELATAQAAARAVGFDDSVIEGIAIRRLKPEIVLGSIIIERTVVCIKGREYVGFGLNTSWAAAVAVRKAAEFHCLPPPKPHREKIMTP